MDWRWGRNVGYLRICLVSRVEEIASGFEIEWEYGEFVWGQSGSSVWNSSSWIRDWRELWEICPEPELNKL